MLLESIPAPGSLGAAAPVKAARSQPSFELVFRPSVDLITIVRRFVSEFYTCAVEDEDVAGRLALATHELLENAAKYTTTGATYLHVDIDRDSGAVTVQTRNRTDATRIEGLVSSFAALATEDPDALYNKMLRSSAAQSEGSGLGLIRIRTEGEMTLELAVTDDLVEIKACGFVTEGEQS